MNTFPTVIQKIKISSPVHESLGLLVTLQLGLVVVKLVPVGKIKKNK